MCGINFRNADMTMTPYHIFMFAGDSSYMPKGWRCMCGLVRFGEELKEKKMNAVEPIQTNPDWPHPMGWDD